MDPSVDPPRNEQGLNFLLRDLTIVASMNDPAMLVLFKFYLFICRISFKTFPFITRGRRVQENFWLQYI